MSSKPAIIDTNVLVSALISPNKDTPPGRIVRAMLEGGFAFTLSDALLAEYREVLNRSHLRKQHGLPAEDLDVLLLEVTRHAIVLHPPPSDEKAPDPKDQHLWDLLAMRMDLILVTGDKLLLNSNRQSRILSPQQFSAE